MEKANTTKIKRTWPTTTVIPLENKLVFTGDHHSLGPKICSTLNAPLQKPTVNVLIYDRSKQPYSKTIIKVFLLTSPINHNQKTP